MTKEMLDALLLYIDARIDEKASHDIEDRIRARELYDELVRIVATKQEVERE